MHELLLFGSVPAARHDQMLQILAGVAAMQPIRIIERHLSFQPVKPANLNGLTVESSQLQQLQALQKQMRGDLYYLQLVGDLTAAHDTRIKVQVAKQEDGSKPVPHNDEEVGVELPIESLVSQKETLQLQFRDLPEVAGRRPVNSRLMVDVDITCDNPVVFMSALNYIHVKTYILDGHRFTHNNIVLLLYRLLRLPQEDLALCINAPIELPTCPLLDPSGTWIMQASIRVLDGSKPEIMTLAMNELLAFKSLVRDMVDMEVGDRLALDTRVRQ